MPDTAASTWVGWSNRQYACAIVELDATAVAEAGHSILIAVQRDSKGIAQIHSLTLRSTAGRNWAEQARKGGATELRVVALKPGDDGAAALDDLDPNERRGRR